MTYTHFMYSIAFSSILSSAEVSILINDVDDVFRVKEFYILSSPDEPTVIAFKFRRPIYLHGLRSVVSSSYDEDFTIDKIDEPSSFCLAYYDRGYRLSGYKAC